MARFKVVGNHAVDGVAPGGTVTIDDDVQAAQLVRSGHLKPVAAKKPAARKQPAKKAAGGGEG